jgi:hypothetical protein
VVAVMTGDYIDTLQLPNLVKVLPGQFDSCLVGFTAGRQEDRFGKTSRSVTYQDIRKLFSGLWSWENLE